MKKILFLAIVSMAFAVVSCGEKPKENQIIPIANTEYSLVVSPDSLWGLNRGNEVLLEPCYAKIQPEGGDMFILTRAGDMALFDARSNEFPLTGQEVSYRELGNFKFFQATGGKVLMKNGSVHMDVTEATMLGELVVMKEAETIGCYTVTGDTVFAPQPYQKMLVIPREGEETRLRALIQDKGKWYILDADKPGKRESAPADVQRYKNRPSFKYCEGKAQGFVPWSSRKIPITILP